MRKLLGETLLRRLSPAAKRVQVQTDWMDKSSYEST
jgi:hypothetical protein